MVDHLTTDPALLGGEGEGGSSSGKHVSRRGGEEDEALGAKEQLDIGEGEGSGLFFFGSAGVFPRLQEEKEGNHSHIHGGLYGRTVGIVGRDAEGMVQELDGHRFYTVRRGVGFGIGAQLSLDAEVDGAQRVLPDVLGPQAGKRLAHGT